LERRVKLALVGDGACAGDDSVLKKNVDKRRRVLGGVRNRPPSLTRTETILLDDYAEFTDRRAVELTVSPLADASEAYLSVPASESSVRVTELGQESRNDAFVGIKVYSKLFGLFGTKAAF
jgi:hypothetical protein